MKYKVLGAAAAVAFTLTGAAVASTIDFQVDYANSSVELNQTGGYCLSYHNCGVSASLNHDLADLSFSLEEGEALSFDFIDFTPYAGGLGYAEGTFEISATLAFSTPSFEVSGGGSGDGFVFDLGWFGTYSGGSLSWELQPSYVTLDDGSELSVSFDDASGFFTGSATTQATVSVDTIGAGEVSAVPLPAGGLLLLGGLGALAAVRRRKS